MQRTLGFVSTCLAAMLLAGCGGESSPAASPPTPQLPSLSIANASIVEGDSGTSVLSFTATLSVASSSAVSASYATADGTAAAGSDYAAANGTLTIPAGSTSATIDVDITGDTLIEVDETFTLSLSGPSGATIGSGTATGTIEDDDAVQLPSLSIANASIVEGDSGTSVLSFTATLSVASSSAVTASYATADGTAAAGSDYAAANGTLIIAAGSTSATIGVDIIGDTLNEVDETFTLSLGNPSGATIVSGTATGTIEDDDAAQLPSLSIADASVAEGNSGTSVLSFTATLSDVSSSAVTASYATADGTAAAGSDYAAANGTLTIPAGSTSATIDVDISGDTLIEVDETFTLSLGSPSGATIGSGTATGTIQNDDAMQLPSLSIASASIVEGDSGTSVLSLAVTLSGASSSAVTASYATADGTAAAGSDYVAANGTLTIPAGSTSATIGVNIIGDTLNEVDETFTLSLGNPSGATIGSGTATGTIEDDDAAQLPSLSIASASIVEGDSGTTVLSFAVTLSDSSTSAVTASYATADGTAAAGSDYAAANGTLTIPAGATSATIDVDIIGDTESEADETFALSLGNPNGATIGSGTATGTIEDDDAAPLPSLSIADASIVEGDSGTSVLSFAVTLSETSSSAVTASYATADGTAAAGSDYAAANGTLTIAAGSTSATIDVDITGDTLNEVDETFTVSLGSPNGATIDSGSATGTIQNDDAAPVFGLDSRPDNQTCVAPPRPGGITDVTAVDAFPSLGNFSAPIKLVLEPVANPRWFIVLRGGQIMTLDPDDLSSLASYSIDVSSSVLAAGEGGLLGLAFHPDYPNTPEIFLSSTRTGSATSMRSVITRVILDSFAAPSPLGSGSVEQEIISVDQFENNHNGGDIAFGPDGFLYFGLGDGGGGGDPEETGQDTTNLLGSFLRLDVTGPSVAFPSNPYAIPTGPQGNPFASQQKCGPGLNNPNNCPEIYAWGVRNPFRWSFDATTGQLWAGDVGQGEREEIDIIERGNNYGWDCREGFLPFESTGCNATFTDPVHDYPRSQGRSVTGGVVYRGSAISGRVGEYFYADYGSGRVWALRSDGQGGYVNEQLLNGPGGPVAFAADASGEVHYANINTGRIMKLVPDGGGGGGDTIPDLLSDSGCVDPTDITQPYAGLVPYDINALFWSDGAAKSRYLGLPNGTTMSIDPQDDWQFPVGTVIVKDFRLNGALIETRHLMRHPDGVWAGYTYEWNAAQSEATRVIGGKTVDIGGQDWVFPSGAECDQCHTSAAGHALGPETAQLNKDFTYPSTGRSDNQLETLDHIMMFASPLPGTPDTLPALVDPMDTSADINDRARAYLHTNCANCHRPGGLTPVDIDLRYTVALQDTNACDVDPQSGNVGLTNPRIIAPGDASRSVLVERVNRRDSVSIGMPPVGSTVVDTAGVDLLTDWVNALGGCQ